MPDPAWIGNIAREVIRRLQSETVETSRASTPPLKLVTVETLRRGKDSREIRVAASCVVTPAAKEEAARRGIKLVRETTAEPRLPAHSPDAAGDALTVQMARRDIALPRGSEVVWTDTPAAEVCRRCAAGQTAVMITCYADVERFAAEITPQVWVLDAKRLSLVAATNAAARIARFPGNHGDVR